MRVGAVGTWLVAVLGFVLACPQEQAEPRGLVVFAAASLTDAFGALERSFEARHPELDVQLVFAGSQALRVQIEHGARADVFASASEDAMEPLVTAGLIERASVFATNTLVVAVPRDNPAGIHTLADLPRAHRIVLGAEDVPVGAYARQMLVRAETTLGPTFADRVLEHVVSNEANVRLVLGKVELGEADAAIVYASDVVGRGVVSVGIDPEANVLAVYPIGVLSAASEPGGARLWIEHVTDATSTDTLARFGFGRPGRG